MRVYLGPRCPDRPSSKEVIAEEVNAQIHKVLDLEASLNPGVRCVP
jgi:hypothetical protein